MSLPHRVWIVSLTLIGAGCSIDPPSGAGTLSGGAGGGPSDPDEVSTGEMPDGEMPDAETGSTTASSSTGPNDDTTSGPADETTGNPIDDSDDGTTTGVASAGVTTSDVASTGEQEPADECATGAITGGGPWAEVGETSGSSHRAGSCGGASAPEIVHEWTPTFSGTFLFGVEGTDFDPVLYVLEGTCNGEEVEVACNANGGSPNFAQVEVTVSAYQTYLVVVDGNPNQSGGFLLYID